MQLLSTAPTVIRRMLCLSMTYAAHSCFAHRQRSVSHGAVAFFLKKFATTRVARMTWGVRDDTSYCADNPEHYKRRDKVKKDAGGTKRLHDVFRTFISEVYKLVSSLAVLTGMKFRDRDWPITTFSALQLANARQYCKNWMPSTLSLYAIVGRIQNLTGWMRAPVRPIICL